MKKTAMLLLCLCLIIGLVACVKEGPSTGSTPDTSQTEPIMPENPTDSEDPADPDDPTKPTGKPGGPGGTSKPTETSKPSNPTDSTNSQDPDNPAVDFETAFDEAMQLGDKTTYVADKTQLEISISADEQRLYAVVSHTIQLAPLPSMEQNETYQLHIRLFVQQDYTVDAEGNLRSSGNAVQGIVRRSENFTDGICQQYLQYFTQQESDPVYSALLMASMMGGAPMDATLLLGNGRSYQFTAMQDGEQFVQRKMLCYNGEQLFLQVEATETGAKITTNTEDGITTMQYDQTGKLLEEILLDPATGTQTRMEYSYTEDRISQVLIYQDQLLQRKVTYHTNGKILTDVYYDAAGQITRQYENSYDENGCLTQRKELEQDGGYWITLFDLQGRQTSSYHYDADGRSLNGTDYVYSEDGYLAEETYHYPAGYRITKYDAAGRVLSYMDYSHHDELMDGYSYAYNATGDVIQHITYDGARQHEVNYDDAGNVISDYTYFNNKLESWYLYTYDAKNQVLSYAAYAFDSYHDCVKLQRKEEYTYDEAGRKTSVAVYLTENSTVPDSLEVFGYDDNGEQITYHLYGAAGVLELWEEYTYDGDGKKLTCHRYSSEGKTDLVFRETWQYDAAGECVANLRYNASDRIIYGYSKEFDETGKLIRHIVYSEDGYVETVYTENPIYVLEYHYTASGVLDYWVELFVVDGQVVERIEHYEPPVH